MKRQHLLIFILASFFIVISLHGIHAHAAISGDEVCGGVGHECSFTDLKKIVQGIMMAIISIGLPLLVVFIIYRFVIAWYSLQQGNANAYKEATQKAGQAVFGFIVVVAIFGGIFIVMLKYLGVGSQYLDLLQKISSIQIIERANAQTTQLPNPLPGINSVYDFILSVLNMVMKFFIYPALIGMWVWSGFSYVLAQGAPEKLKKAHNLVMWAFISTLIAFVAQGFLVSVRGSVQKILPGSTVTTTPVSDNGLNNKNQGAGTICYSNDNCLFPLTCKFNSRGDKGTCEQ